MASPDVEPLDGAARARTPARPRAETRRLLALQQAVLERMARGGACQDTLARICELIDDLVPGVLATIMLRDERGVLRVAAAPRVPRDTVTALDGLRPGPASGSCGTAAYTGEPQIVADTRIDPRWELLRDFAARHGIRACWSMPILGHGGQIAGTFAISRGEPGPPTSFERTLLDTASALAGVAIEWERDAADRRRVQHRLTLSMLSLDRIQTAVYWLSPDGAILFANAGAYRMLGYPAGRLVGMSVYDISPNATPGFWPEHWARLAASGSLTFETDHRRVDGTTLPVEITANHVAADGEEFNFAFVRDITERRAAAAEQQRVEQQMLHLQKLESLGVLAGGVAHDFNNLLTAVVGNASIALEDLEPDHPARVSIQCIQTAARRATALCGQMLAYAGSARPRLEPCDLNGVVGEIAGLIETSMTRDRRIELELGEVPTVSGDVSQLGQVALNLITNAVDATQRDDGRVTVRTGAADAGAPADHAHVGDALRGDRYAYLEVVDTGDGMSDDVVARVFDPFYSTKVAGRGLGLAAVLGIVRGHGGAIRVKSAPGEGSTFRVLLPAVDEALPAPTAATCGDPELRAVRGRVLVVDDEADVCSVARRALERAGAQVVCASSGAEAIALLDTDGSGFDGVLLDLTMPEVPGEVVLRRARALRPRPAVVLMSGQGEHAVAERVADLDYDAFLPKPFTPAALRDIVADAIPARRE